MQQWCSCSCSCSCGCLSIYLSHPSIHLSIRKFENLSIYLSISLSVQVWKQSSIFEVCNIKNEAPLRDFLDFWTWQHQKRSNSARLPSIMESWVHYGLVPMRFAFFPVHVSEVLRLPRKSEARSYEVLHLSHEIIFPKLKIWCSKMQPLPGNQRPDLLTSRMTMSLVMLSDQ